MTGWTFASILPTLPVKDVARTRELLTAALPFEIASGSAAHAVLALGPTVAVKLVRGQGTGTTTEATGTEATVVLAGTTGLESLHASLVRFIEATGVVDEDDDDEPRLEVDEVANVGWGKRQFRVTVLPERHVLQFVQDKVIPQC